MTKEFFTRITKRLRLRNRFLKNKSQENRMLYTQQRNYCLPLLRKVESGIMKILMKRKS